MKNNQMTHLDQLEAQSIYILREACANFKSLALLWSIGKDSAGLNWRKVDRNEESLNHMAKARFS